MKFYRRVLAYFRRDWHLVLSLVLLICISLAVGLMQAWPATILVDTVINPNAADTWMHRVFRVLLRPFPGNMVGQIVGIALVGMSLKVMQDTIAMVKNMINHKLRYNGMTRARHDLFLKLTDLSPAYHKSRSQGDSIYRVTNDVWGLWGVLDTFVATFASVITPLAMITVMASINVKMTIIALTVAPALMLANYWFSQSIKRTTVEFKRRDTDLTTAVQRAVASVGLIQLFGRQRCELDRFEQAVQGSAKAGMRMNWQEQLYPLVVQTVFALGGCAIFGYGGYLAYQDSQRAVATGFTIGTVIAYMAYLGQLWDPISRVIGFKAAVQGHVASSERVFHVLDEVSKITDAKNAARLPLRPRTLVLHDVGFAYDGHGADETDHQPVLEGVHAKIKPGQMVAFVGPSGAGKSTLLHLLPRFYDPTAGYLALDGHDLRKVKVDDVRSHIALVPQDSPLLPTSIAENIKYGRPDATDAEVKDAAERAGAADFIERLPDGYDTIITEGGGNLSGGQKQRLSIARALLTESPILVLDEPTSAQDARHERRILETLRKLKPHRTVVLVTHRLDTVTECDQIFVLHDGKLVEQGTHEELLAKGGLYSAMSGGHVEAA